MCDVSGPGSRGKHGADFRDGCCRPALSGLPKATASVSDRLTFTERSSNSQLLIHPGCDRDCVRILQAANFVGPRAGTARVLFRELARIYAAAGHDVVTVLPGTADRTRATETGRTIEVASPPVPATSGVRMITRWSAVEDVLAVVSPDRVEVSDRFVLARAGAWARRHRVRSAVFVHDGSDAVLGLRLGGVAPVHRLTDAWNGWLARSFDAVVCTLGTAAAEFSRIGAANLIPVPADLPRARAGELAARLGRLPAVASTV